MTEIKINGARFFAYHGVLEHEKNFGNEFEIDIDMKCDISGLKYSDDLNKTVDYQSVYNLAGKIIGERKYNLIETVNLKICESILENFPLVNSVRVSIRKPNAPLGIIDSVEVINELHRKQK